MGMYCFDTGDYTNNEVRNLYYDNFGNKVGKDFNGAPIRSTESTEPPTPSVASARMVWDRR